MPASSTVVRHGLSRWVTKAIERAGAVSGRSLSPEQVIRLERKVLAVSEAVLGTEHRFSAGAKSLLAETLDRVGQSSEALVLRTEGLDEEIRHHGGTHPNALAAELQLAGVFAAANKTRKAKRALIHVIDETRLRPDVDLTLTLAAMYRLGRIYLEAGKPKKAQQMLEPALIGYRARFGEEHEETWRAANSLAVALGRQERYAAAIAILRQLLTLQGRVVSVDHADMIVARWQLAEWLHAIGEYPEAEAIATSVLASKVRLYGYSHDETVAVRQLLAKIFRASTKPPKGRIALR